MKRSEGILYTLGTKKPINTRRNNMIKKAMKIAAKDYRFTFTSLVNN